MDFGSSSHVEVIGVAAKSGIRVLPTPNDGSLDDQLLQASNRAARNILQQPANDALADASLYTERLLRSSSSTTRTTTNATKQQDATMTTTTTTSSHPVATIQEGDLVVIFESFDNLNFVYAQKGQTFSNRNGQFPHDDFVDRVPFGSKIRSRNNRGYGFVHLLKPTPELWARSLTHRTQIVHELDASMIVFYLELRPNMVVCESGTGSGALSHCILRTIAPRGHLHTYEFNQDRVQRAQDEFRKNKVQHLVTVHHQDVCCCGNQESNGNGDNSGGFVGVEQGGAHAVVLDLPNPWLAVPHAAYTLQSAGRIASYSPCMEQVQRTIAALKENGFHSIQTLEFRLREHYVDQVELDDPPAEKRPRIPPNPHLPPSNNNHNARATRTRPTNDEAAAREPDSKKPKTKDENGSKEDASAPTLATPAAATDEEEKATKKPQPQQQPVLQDKKRIICTRPFTNMRGHTAFLTFATAGHKPRPKPIS